METTEQTSTETQGGKAPANVSVDQLAALLKKRAITPAAAGEGASASGATGETAEAGATEETVEQTTTDAAAGADAEQNGDPSPGGSEDGESEQLGESEESGEEGEAEGEELPKGVKQLQARVGKLTQRAKTAEGRVAALEKELAEKSERAESAGTPAAIVEIDPVAMHPLVSEASKAEAAERANAQAASNWLKQLQTDPEGTVERLRKAGVEVADADGAAAVLESLRQRSLEEAQFQRLQRTHSERQLRAEVESMRAHHAKEAVESYAWMKDEKSPEKQAYNAFVKDMPWAAKLPARDIFLADAVTGRMARLKAAKPAVTLTRPAAKPGAGAPAAVPTKVGAAAPKADPKKVKVVAAETQFKQSGRAKDLPALLKARREAAMAAG